MIKCKPEHLKSRCRERGFTLAEVMPCVVSTENDFWIVDPDHPAYPRERRTVRTPPRPGLGDMVSAGLAAVGITPERVSRVLGRPCGCKERAAKLNELGRRIGIG